VKQFVFVIILSVATQPIAQSEFDFSSGDLYRTWPNTWWLS